jgi:hypothetical protein
MFRLNATEWENLRCQIGISNSAVAGRAERSSASKSVTRPMTKTSLRSGISKDRGGRRYRPYAFTEQGVAMLSSVLRSARAVEVNIAIMRTFVQLRRLMDSNRELARKIEAMEEKYDEQFAVVFEAIKNLIADDEARKSRPKRPIGFIP